LITVIAGVDGTGKSTLANNLIKDLNGDYVHFSNPKDMADGKKQYFDFLRSTDKDKLYICDRYHDGEWVYAPLYRGYMPNYMVELETELIQNHNYLLTYVTADVNEIIRRTRERGEDFVKSESHYQILLDNYMNNFLTKQTLPFTIVDTTNTTPDQCTQLVEDDIKKINLIWDSLRYCVNTVQPYCKTTTPIALPRGNVRAKYMIVGQNPAGKGRNTNKYVTMWFNGARAEFLLDVLKKAGIYMDCWFTNIVECSTTDNKITNEQVSYCLNNFKMQVNIIKPQKIFTLGQEATKYVQANCKDIEVIEVEHPTYMKRFYGNKSDKIDEYVSKFKVGD
jgi:uracil-DNA glycosylase family 4